MRKCEIGKLLAGCAMIALISSAAGNRAWTFEEGQWNPPTPPPASGEGLTLAREGEALLPIVLSDNARLPEESAAAQLAAYLEKITGARFQITREFRHPAGAPAIFVRQREELSAEEWRIIPDGVSLYLEGGYPCGTLYAVFHLLEDEFGVHWWTPDSETVPRQSTLTVSRRVRSGKPVFAYRCISYFYAAERKSRDVFEGNRMISAVKYDDGLFVARNRLHNQGNKDYHIALKYGGQIGFGPPSFVHTYYLYVEPKEHFDKHPEWFSLIGGKRRYEAGQLDVMNPELRAYFLSRLLENIQATLGEDARAGLPPRLVFDISPNDHEGYDESEASRALVEREGTEMAPQLDFVNDLAAAVKERFPEVRLETLAYKATEEPPRTIHAADNVIVTVTDTRSNPARPQQEKDNSAFLDLLKRWKNRATHLRVWDYANAYGIFRGSLPLPMAISFYSDLQAYQKIGIEGVNIEIGDPWTGNDRDFLYWVAMKGMENPEPPFSELEKTFTEGFWGPAGVYIREYYALLRNAAASPKADGLIPFGGHLSQFAFLDLKFLRTANDLFDRAEEAVTKVTADPEALHRVRRARQGVDEAILRRYAHGLRDEWNSEADFPLSLDVVKARYEKTLKDTLKAAVLSEHFPAWSALVEDLLLVLAPHPRKPLDFQAAAKMEVFDFLPDQMGWLSGVEPIQSALPDAASGGKLAARPVPDEDADAGVALEVTAPKGSFFWAYFGLSEEQLVKQSLPEFGNEYQWVKLGKFPSTARGFASLFTTAESPTGVIWLQSDYYPKLAVSSRTPNCEWWIKARRAGDAFRISRAVIVKK